MNNILLAILLCLSYSITAQDLTLAEAKRITLANNFGIQIAKNNIEIAENQTDKSVNGYLPTVSASAGLSGNFGGSNQKFGNGQEASTANAFTWGGNASVQTDYTILDKQRDLTLDQLKAALSVSNLQLKSTIEQSLLQVYNNYYQVAQLVENINVLADAINISKERLRRAEIQLEYGQGSGLSVLNAKVDNQRDSVNLLNAYTSLDNAKRNLNVAMGRSAAEDFNIAYLNPQDENKLVLETLIQQSKKDNLTVQLNRQNLSVNEMNLGIIDAEKKPTLSAGVSYNFNYSDNPVGAFIDQSNSQGLSGNVGLNWIIFDGSRTIRRQNAAINLTNQKLQIEELEQRIEGEITNSWALYQNALFVFEVEQNAVETNRENFNRTEEQVKAGQLTSLEFRQAQLNLLNAQTSLNNARLNVKLSEIQLQQLAGQLID